MSISNRTVIKRTKQSILPELGQLFTTLPAWDRVAQQSVATNAKLIDRFNHFGGRNLHLEKQRSHAADNCEESCCCHMTGTGCSLCAAALRLNNPFVSSRITRISCVLGVLTRKPVNNCLLVSGMLYYHAAIYQTQTLGRNEAV